jgi:hypothetical protein
MAHGPHYRSDDQGLGNIFNESIVCSFDMRFITWSQIFIQLLLICHPIFAMDENLQSDLLSRMSLREHFATTLSTREQERYDLESQLDNLRAIEPRNQYEAQQKAMQERELLSQIQVVERSGVSTQRQLQDTEVRLNEARTQALTQRDQNTTRDISVITAAANVAHTQTALQAVRDMPLAFNRPPVPTTGVIAQNGNVTTTIEQWRDGSHYRVNRYTDGPNQGRFAEGGRQKLSDAEVRQMGGQLRTQHVEGLRTNLSTSEARIAGLRQELSQAPSSQRAEIQNRIDQQTRTQQELRQELRRVEARPVRDFVVSGVSFAAMSVAITASFNIISQTVENDGDLSKVDLAQATAFVTEATFWRDLSGNYFGGMAGRALSAFLPGPFRVLGTIAGGTIGTQLVSGRWREADWAMLGAQTIGSTIGYLLGAFIGSLMGPLAPIAIIAFSIAGAWLAEKALEWIRGVFSPKITSYRPDGSNMSDSAVIDTFREALEDSSFQELENLSTEELRKELWATHNELVAYQERGNQAQSDEQRINSNADIKAKQIAHEKVRRALDRRRMQHADFNLNS